jgi:hypothetical protein
MEIPQTNSGFSEYMPLEGMEMKCELEIREVSPPEIVSFSISRKHLCGERQRQEMVGATVSGD